MFTIENATVISRRCMLVIHAPEEVRQGWIEALAQRLAGEEWIVFHTEADQDVAPGVEAILVLEAADMPPSPWMGAESHTVESIPLPDLAQEQRMQVVEWVVRLARMCLDRVSMRRMIDRFEARIRNASGRVRMADLLEDTNRRLQEQSARDALTGVANRGRFQEQFDYLWGSAAGDGTPIGLVLLDIDHFKKLNDSLGHQEGDRCLREVAQCLEQVVGTTINLLARYGGEEFVALLPGVSRDGARQMSEAMLQSVRNLDLKHPEHPLGHVTVSAGVTWTIPGLTSSADDFLHAADEMLYQAKHAGRDRWIFCAIGDDSESSFAG